MSPLVDGLLAMKKQPGTLLNSGIRCKVSELVAGYSALHFGLQSYTINKLGLCSLSHILMSRLLISGGCLLSACIAEFEFLFVCLHQVALFLLLLPSSLNNLCWLTVKLPDIPYVAVSHTDKDWFCIGDLARAISCLYKSYLYLAPDLGHS